jgi:hypothetical protein
VLYAPPSAGGSSTMSVMRHWRDVSMSDRYRFWRALAVLGVIYMVLDQFVSLV